MHNFCISNNMQRVCAAQLILFKARHNFKNKRNKKIKILTLKKGENKRLKAELKLSK